MVQYYGSFESTEGHRRPAWGTAVATGGM